MISDLNKLGIALKSLDAMKIGTVGVNVANVEAYRIALKGLSVEQSVFALASKGATEEQIRQILIINEATAKDVEATLAKAGLTTATKALTQAEMVEIATKNGVAKAEAEELLRKIGITATEEGQAAVKKQVTLAMLEQAVASGNLTTAESAQIAAMLGLNAVESANIGITNVLTASFAKLWAVITEHPIGAILTAIGAVAVGTIAYINKANKNAKKALVEAHESAEQVLEDTKTSLSDDKSKLQSINSGLETTKQKIQEISSIGAPTLVDQNELNKLSTTNAQLDTQKTLLENNIQLKQKSAALDAKELLKTQVEMEYSNILDGNSIESHNESYSYKDHAKYQASNLKNAYNIYMKALREGNIKKQQLAQELIDVSAGDSAVLTSELLEIIESFKYEDGTIIEGYEEIYNEYIGLIYNLQSLTNPDTFLDIAKSVTSNTGIDYEKAISDAYKLAYEGNFNIDKLNQDFVKALSDAGIDESTINYIFSLKQQEYQLLVDKINDKYKISETPDKIRQDYWNANGNIYSEYIDVDEETKKRIAEINAVNQNLNEYAKENPVEFQLVSSFDENFETLDKYIEEERIKAENNTDYVGDYIANAIKRIYDEAKVQSSTLNDKNPFSLSLSETIEQLNTQLKPAMDSLKSAWQDIFTDDGFALNSIDIISTCDSIKSKLDELNEIEGIIVDYSAYDHFIDVLNSSDSKINDVQESFNDLAASITQAGLSGSEDFDTLKAALEDLGVVNSEMVAFDSLTSNIELLEEKVKQAGLTIDEFVIHTDDGTISASDAAQAFIEEMVGAENCSQALALLQLKQMLVSENSLNTSDDINACYMLAQAAGIATESIRQLAVLNAAYEKESAAGNTQAALYISSQMEDVKKRVQDEFADLGNIKVDWCGIGGGKSAASKAGKDAGEAYADALKDELSNLNDVIGAIGNIINNQIDLYNDQKDAAVDALEAQKEAAEEALEAEKALVQEQIDAKQAEIDKIKEAAEAKKNDIDLQQKQYELARLQNQRTILVYSEDKGMHYVQDTKEIRSAKEAVTEAQENIQIAGLEKEISGLEDTIDSLDQKIEESNKYYDDLIEQTEKYWDSLIKGLEDYKSRWDELAEIEEQAKVLVLLEQMGISTNDVLSMSESAFQGFKESYTGLLTEMYKGNDQMLESLSQVAGVDMSSLNGYLETTAQSIDDLKNADLSSLSDSFDDVTTSAGNTSNAINGSGGSPTKSSSSGNQTTGSSSGSGDSLKSAIKDQTESAIEDLTTQKELFNGDEGLTSDVQEVIDKIGGGSGGEGSAEGSQGSESDSNNLKSALKEQTAQALNDETGIPAQKRAWEELDEPLDQAEKLITTIRKILEDLDGRTFTVTLNVEGNGDSIPSGEISGTYGGGSGSDHSHGGGGKSRVNGTAHIEGSANAKGNWGAKKGGRTLVGELGQELWVHSADGTFETVGNNGAEFINIKPNDIIFNHLQTKQLLDKGNIIGRGKSYARGTAYAGGTASGNTINTLDGATVTSDGHVLIPIRPGDSVWELQKAFEPLLQKIDGNLEYLAGNAIIEHTRQLEKMISRPNTTSAVTNRNIQPVIHQNIALNCPNVTNNSGIEYIQKELGHLSQMAMQEPIKKY